MNLLWAVIILAAAVTVAVGAMPFVRRTAPEGSYSWEADAEAASAFAEASRASTNKPSVTLG